MVATLDRNLTWAPRVISLVFALCIAIFATDVFDQGRPFGWSVVALAMHLIPAFLVIVIAAIAWRNEWIGALGAGILAAFYLTAKGPGLHWSSALPTIGPLAVLSLLYAANAIRHRHPAMVGGGRG
jgi:hypothetical protein